MPYEPRKGPQAQTHRLATAQKHYDLLQEQLLFLHKDPGSAPWRADIINAHAEKLAEALGKLCDDIPDDIPGLR